MILSSCKMILSLPIFVFCCEQEWDVIFSFSFFCGKHQINIFLIIVWYPFINQRYSESEVSFPRTHHKPGHSHPKRLHSFWSAPRITTSGQTWFSEHEFFLYSWQSHIWPKVHELQTSSVGTAQRSQLLVLNEQSRVSRDESETWTAQCRVECAFHKVTVKTLYFSIGNLRLTNLTHENIQHIEMLYQQILWLHVCHVCFRGQELQLAVRMK